MNHATTRLFTLGFAAAALVYTTGCVSSGKLNSTVAPLQSQIGELQKQNEELKGKTEKLDAFVTNDLRLGEALEVGRRVDSIEKKVADLQRQLDEFQTNWDQALREHKTLVETDVKTFERINNQRNAKSNQMMQTSVEKQIQALDQLRSELQKIQSELRVIAPETTGEGTN
jgi:DNA repair exonuclease SbcCD ATPase subunit